jgi:hypothetical protein
MLHVKMHNLVVIYSLFYGGFLQAMQAELRFKRIQQNPMKGHFKDHEVFAKLVFNALMEYQLHVWLSKTNLLETAESMEAGAVQLLHLEASFTEFCKQQLTLKDKMICLAVNFMKQFAAFE